MKKQFLILLLITITCNLMARNRVIINPYYEVKASGLFNVTKIELRNNETRIYIHSTFIPKWWVRFSKKTFIKDSDTGEKLYVSAMIGGDLDKEIYMPASGDSSFVLIFPKLQKTTTRIDYGEGDNTYIFGISLDSKKHKVTASTIPENVRQWIDAELSKAKKKTLVDYNSPDFFTRDTARLIGYIKGYDRRLGFSTGIIYAGNELTNEDFPMIVNIYEDGRFEAAIPLNYPRYTYVTFINRFINFYIEPGQTLSMILNWDEFLTADRLRNIQYEFKNIQFKGPAARINEELLALKMKQPDYNDLIKSVKTLSPNDFKAKQLSRWKESESGLEQILKDKDFTAQSKTILRNEITMSNAFYLYEYLMNRSYEASKDTTGDAILKIPVDSTYYDFLQKMPLNDPSILISSNFSSFINRFEFSRPFSSITINSFSSPSFDWYLFTELGLKPSAEDTKYLKFQSKTLEKLSGNISGEAKDTLLKTLKEKGTAFVKRYSSYLAAYKEKYQNSDYMKKAYADMFLEQWRQKDSILLHYYNLKPNLAYETAKVRSLKFAFDETFKGKKDEARMYLTALEKGITNPFLMQEAEMFFHKSYPETPKEAYNLPEGKGTEIFRKIIDQYKGKMLFVDFWSIFCGPCISNIKLQKADREKYKGNKDFEFIFITSAAESPLERYNNFVKEQELTNTFRLSADDFRYLRQLFKFNGIPRYVLISKDGQVLNDDFPMYRFKSELEHLLAKK